MILPVGKRVGAFCDIGSLLCGGPRIPGPRGGRVGVVVHVSGNRE